MPPKPKYTREEMVEASIKLIEERGVKSLTARELGKYLSMSSCPIFTIFKDMDDLKRAVEERAISIFNTYMDVADNYQPSYKMRGLQWVKFAAEHPKLFGMLFAHKTGVATNINDAVSYLPFGSEKDIEIIKRDYNATDEQAERLFGQMWIYTFGLCVIVSKNVYAMTLEEAASKIGEIFNGMVYVIKNVPDELVSITPQKNGEGETVKYPNLSTEEE